MIIQILLLLMVKVKSNNKWMELVCETKKKSYRNKYFYFSVVACKSEVSLVTTGCSLCNLANVAAGTVKKFSVTQTVNENSIFFYCRE